MTVAIVIPTFNRERFLETTIAGVQRQTVENWELLVVDDGSTDATCTATQRVADRDRRIKLLTQANRGIAAARNLGITNLGANSEYVMFLDDDDVLTPYAIEVLSAALAADPHGVAAYGLARPIDWNGQEIRNDLLTARQRDRRGIRDRRLVSWPASAETTFDVLAFANVIMTPGSVLIRRSALDRAGFFREPAADWNMWLRLSMQGHLVFIRETVVDYRRHPGNVSANVLLSSKRKFTVHWRLLWSRDLTTAQRRTAWLGFFYYYADLARLGRTLRRLFARVAYKRTGAA